MSVYKDVRSIRDGSNVDENITNRPISDLTSRTDYLKNQLEGLYSTSQRLLIPSRPIDDSCVDSNLVYFDDGDEKWLPSDLFSEGVEASTQINLSSSSYIQGVVKNITGPAGSKLGDIYIYGLINSVIANNILESGQSPEKGKPYYMSAAETGKITINAPITGESFVGKFISLTDFLFTPTLPSGANGLQHTHKWFILDKTKFLPSGVGPAGEAKWVYASTEMPLFPPIPYESFVLMLNGVELFYGRDYDIRTDGLHYWSDVYDPTDVDVEYKGYYTKVSSDSIALVSRLTAKTDNLLIKASAPPYADAKVGDLDISMILQVIDSATVSTGSSVIKNITVNETTGEITLHKGLVVEKIIAGNGIDVDKEQGSVTISTESVRGKTVEISDIILLNVKEKILSGSTLPYLEYTKNVESKIIAKFYFNIAPVDISVNLTAFGDVDDSNPVVMEVKYRIHKMSDAPIGVSRTSNKEIILVTTLSQFNILTIPKENLVKNCFVTLSIKRLKNDDYSGNMCQVMLSR